MGTKSQSVMMQKAKPVAAQSTPTQSPIQHI